MAARNQPTRIWRWFACLGLVLLLGTLAGCEVKLPTPRPAEPPLPTPTPTATPLPPPPPAATTPGGTGVRVVPASQQIEEGGTTTADIFIDNVAGLWGAEVQLQFDPTLVQVQDANLDADGVQIEAGSFLSSDVVAENKVDNAAGIVNYAVTQKAPREPVNGSGLLATITFQGVSQGNSVPTLSVVELSTNQGQPILVTPQRDQAADTDSESPSLVISPTPCSCYVVKRGDTLYSIARRHGVSMWKLASYNNIRNPNRIYVGQVIHIPPR
jgi:LysM repeat protein